MPWTHFPEMSSDGKQISYTDGGRLCILDRDTQEVTFSIALPTRGFVFPAWSQDKKRMLLASGFGDPGSDLGAWILDLETKEIRRILTGPYTVAAWSPDGSKIAVDFRKAESWERFEIWIIDLEENAKKTPDAEKAPEAKKTPDAEKALGTISDAAGCHGLPGTRSSRDCIC
jgi:Tol biopolymer transport system component